MFNFIARLYQKIQDHFAFKRKLKEMRKRDPYIYK
jgi:hypothetical protein